MPPAAAVFVVLAAAGLLRARRHPGAWSQDLSHPVRAPFARHAALRAHAAGDLGGAGRVRPVRRRCGGGGVLGQLAVTWWLVGRWWQAREAGGGQPWAGITPAFSSPRWATRWRRRLPAAGPPRVVGAAVRAWRCCWPLVASLVVVRLLQHGFWPERMRPVAFVSSPRLRWWGWRRCSSAPRRAGAGCAGAWPPSARPGRRELPRSPQPFGLAQWSMSFPLAALASLTLRLGRPAARSPGWVRRCWRSSPLVVAALVLGTLRGLRDGSLLAPSRWRCCSRRAERLRGALYHRRPLTEVCPMNVQRRAAIAAAAALAVLTPARGRAGEEGHADAGDDAGAAWPGPTAGAASAIAEIVQYNVLETLTKINSDSRTTPLLARAGPPAPTSRPGPSS